MRHVRAVLVPTLLTLAAVVPATLAAPLPPLAPVPVPPNLELQAFCTYASTGDNPYWRLLPGWTLRFAGTEGGEVITLLITVTPQTKVVDGVETRVVVEEERADGELVEISYNYFAMCQETGTLFYFGEDVDIYENGVVVSHEGAWLAGVDNAKAGVMMPGAAAVGQAYFQEVAPFVALDFAVVLSTSAEHTVPAGTFTGVVDTLESTPLEPGNVGMKAYARGIGLIIDPPVELLGYGFA